jgi:hypothetical protein
MAPEPNDDDVSRELAEVAGEPLLPAEKKLIAWSLILGLVLLALLVWISDTFFAA